MTVLTIKCNITLRELIKCHNCKKKKKIACEHEKMKFTNF